MAPAQSHDSDDDPVTATYDVYLTPPVPSEQILLLQYPNRSRTRPYNARHGAAPETIRLKPNTGHLELDINLDTANNFNKYQGLRWGDALKTAREVHNSSATFGSAAGFAGAKPRAASRVVMKDSVDRRIGIENDMMGFEAAESGGKVMHAQTLGGQIVRQEGEHAAGPGYFVGAFRGKELHLTRVDGTVGMRPQFHYLDAEEQRARIAGSRVGEEGRTQGEARAVLAKNRTAEEAERGRAEDRMRRVLQAAEAEPWVGLEYVDEDQEEAYERFRERMFVRDVENATKLKAAWDGEEYLDQVALPRRESPTRRRKRAKGKKATAAAADGGNESDGEDGNGGDAVAGPGDG